MADLIKQTLKADVADADAWPLHDPDAGAFRHGEQGIEELDRRLVRWFLPATCGVHRSPRRRLSRRWLASAGR